MPNGKNTNVLDCLEKLNDKISLYLNDVLYFLNSSQTILNVMIPKKMV
jgi:hypothetical protein